MSINNYIEEDFRFATSLQIKNYTQEDFYVKPHLPGFAFVQLLDQMTGHVLSTSNPHFLIEAPGGTAYWLSQHFYSVPTTLLLSRDSCNRNTFNLINQLDPAVVFPKLDIEPSLVDCCDITCVVLALLKTDLVSRYQQLCQHSILSRRPMLIYDPNRLLQGHLHGKYFLNSSIWVTQGYGNRST